MMESYLLKSSISLLVFYLLYRVILHHEVNNQVKRFVGLACVLFSTSFFLLPNLNLVPVEIAPVVIQNVVETSIAIKKGFSATLPKDAMSTFLLVYLIGVGVFSLRFIAGVLSLFHLYFTSEKMTGWGFIVVAAEKKISPFTFFNLLFIQKEDLQTENIGALITHEQIHREQRHTIDTLVLQLFTILYWFHPVVWLFQKDIRAQHEFLADEEVLKKGFDKLDYQNMLFEEQTGVSFKSVNYLSNKTSLKQRFNMMEKPKFNTKSSYVRAVIFLPLMAIAVFISSFSPTIEKVRVASDLPTFKIYSDNGPMDLKEGISKAAKELFVIAKLSKNKADEAVEVTKISVIHLSGGQSWNSLEARYIIDVQDLFSTRKPLSGDMLLLVVEEYETKIGTIKPRKLISFKIPVK